MTSFLDTINYASCNEDGRSECRALRLGPADRVLCITGSGARPLDLLTQRPGRIVTVDINPCQHHLLRLKMAAIQHLDYDSFLAFIGVTTSADRVATYRRICTDLPAPTRAFWDQHEAAVASGVLYAGRWERHFRRLARAVAWIRPRLRRQLFESTTLDEQATVWDRWRGGVWPSLLRLMTAQAMWRYVLQDPGFYRFVPDDFSIRAYIEDALNTAARRILFRESAFATLLFHGHYRTPGPLPLHLQRDHYATIRAGLPRLHLVDGSLTDVLHASKERFTAFSLSDFGSYCDRTAYQHTWAHIARAATPRAGICERQFLVKRDPDEATNTLQRDTDLEAALARDDRSIFYTFIVGRLVS
jgi:S-adenosylmethionine-diacylglycerol 3-amino-3-carboxypropyl transferase